MIRHKYWWPGMNLEIADTVQRCFECQISTETKHTEPAKMTKLPSRSWTTVEVDFCGPFPNGRYALVVTDQYSRYPEVEFTTTTSFEATRKKLKKSSRHTVFLKTSRATTDRRLTRMHSATSHENQDSGINVSHHVTREHKVKWKDSTS
jgi:hypothetical protein